MNSPAFYGKLKSNLHREAKKMAALPKDPFILFSVINTKLRDFYPSLDGQVLHRTEELPDRAALEAQLAAIGMTYDPSQNKFL